MAQWGFLFLQVQKIDSYLAKSNVGKHKEGTILFLNLDIVIQFISYSIFCFKFFSN